MTQATQSNGFGGWSEFIYNSIIFHPDIPQQCQDVPRATCQTATRKVLRGNRRGFQDEICQALNQWQSMTGLTNCQVLNRQVCKSIVTCRIDFDYGHFAMFNSFQTEAEASLHTLSYESNEAPQLSRKKRKPTQAVFLDPFGNRAWTEMIQLCPVWCQTRSFF